MTGHSESTALASQSATRLASSLRSWRRSRIRASTRSNFIAARSRVARHDRRLRNRRRLSISTSVNPIVCARLMNRSRSASASVYRRTPPSGPWRFGDQTAPLVVPDGLDMDAGGRRQAGNCVGPRHELTPYHGTERTLMAKVPRPPVINRS